MQKSNNQCILGEFDWPGEVRFTMDTYRRKELVQTEAILGRTSMLGRTGNWNSQLKRIIGSAWSVILPAYSIGDGQMRPVTKITVFGVRLGIAALAAYWLIIFIGTHLPGVSQIQPKVNDKLQHFSAFFLLGTLLCYVTTSERWLIRFATIGVVGMTYAALDEWTQSFIPGRYPDVRDFVADSLGLWSAITVYLLAKVVWQLYRSQSK